MHKRPIVFGLNRLTDVPGLITVTYRPVRSLRDSLSVRDFSSIESSTLKFDGCCRQSSVRFDVVWCFDVNLYSDLRQFRAPLKIFHPVDQVSLSYQVDVAAYADIVLSVSDEILANMRRHQTPQLRIEHGLGRDFVDLARQRTTEPVYRSRSPLKAGYVGNLTNALHSIARQCSGDRGE